MRRVARSAAPAAACACLLAGCGGIGVGGPAATTSAGGVPPAVRAATRSHEVPTPVPPSGRVANPSPGAADAVRGFAMRFINWNAQTVTGVMSGLARASIGQARSAMTLAAAQVAGTDEIVQNGIANAGSVEAVARLAGGAGRYVVVTRERTTATLTNAYDGLRPAWHVTVATVTRLPAGGWVVSGWQPEN